MHGIADPPNINKHGTLGGGAGVRAFELADHTVIEYTSPVAITKSAKKAHRQSLRRRKQNDMRKKALATQLKVARLAPKGDKAALAAAYKAIDKAMKRGLIKKNTAARRKARVARLLKV